MLIDSGCAKSDTRMHESTKQTNKDKKKTAQKIDGLSRNIVCYHTSDK
tara:strand:+ start:2516 stop:2659 length:144 start_codon:yes stop_codon:yes gene_type:complete